METKKSSLLSNGLLWFGAAVSIAEIQTGTYFAYLGMKKGFLAIIVGHIIGCFFMFLAGLIGANAKQSSMETVKRSFGYYGGKIFAILNVIQLVGWTGIMVYDGALAADEIITKGIGFWSIIIGVLIFAWIVLGITNIGKVSTVAMTLLFILTLILSKVVFFDSNIVREATKEAISFGGAVELAATMPLSWLPVISDYTKEAKEPFKATLLSVIVYGTVSVWMYVIGMGAAIYTGETDIALIMVKAGLGIVGLGIVVFSTVTTTFLDVFSAGVSFKSISEKANEKTVAIISTIIGTVGAMFLPLSDITGFLYFIGSVFAPMSAVLIVDYFFLKKNSIKDSYNITNIVIWVLGFIIYRLLMHVDVIIGSSLLSIILTMIIAIVVGKVSKVKG